MSRKKRDWWPFRRRSSGRDAVTSWLCSQDAYDTLCVQGYTTLAHNPEIMTAVGKIADLISSMTIHLMANTSKGDIRLKNELSRKIDINPNRYMTRKSLMYIIVRTMLLDGNGNAFVYPRTRDGLLEDLIPIKPSQVSVTDNQGFGYTVQINGVEYSPDDVLHFVANPDPERPWMGQGYRICLKDVAQNLKQAAATERGFMEAKWKPSLVIKVDANAEEFSSPSGRKKLLDEYNGKETVTLEDILAFHVRFEHIHPFQDGNGRVGRLIMFKECLKHNIVPFIIEDSIKMFYYRGLQEWDREKGYLTDTCLSAQDTFKKYLDYFRIPYEN